MSFLDQWIGELLSYFKRITPKGVEVNTTVIPFASKTTKLVDKSFGYCKLLFVAVEGNIKNSDVTTIKYKPHDSNTWRQKQIYGVSHAKFNTVIDELEVTPAYGDTRFGRCVVTYEGDYWSGKYIGIADTPTGAIIEQITTIRDIFHLPKTFIVNPLFDQDFTGWYIYGDPTIRADLVLLNVKYVYFKPLTNQRIFQYFPIPLPVDSLTDFYIVLKSNVLATNVLFVEYRYTDQSFTIEYFQVSDTTMWEKHVLSPTTGKQVEHIIIGTLSSYNSITYLKQIITVF